MVAAEEEDDGQQYLFAVVIDDYFSRFSAPAEVIPMVAAAAEQEGLRIDYLARESACAQAGHSSSSPSGQLDRAV